MNITEVIKSVADMIGDLLVEGTVKPTGWGYTFNSDDFRRFPLANQLKGYCIYFNNAATLTGQQSYIASHAAGSPTICVVPSLPGQPLENDKFLLLKEFSGADYWETLKRAHNRGRDIYLIPFMATISLVATIWEYAVPSGFKWIDELRIVPSGHTDYDLDNVLVLHRGDWDIRANAQGTQVIMFDPRFIDLDEYDKEIVYIIGQRKPKDIAAPVSGSINTPEVPEDFLVYKMAALMSQKKLIKDWNQVQFLVRESDREESKMFRYPKPTSVRIP